MSVRQEHQWITGPEYGAELRRLVREGAPEDDPRVIELPRRIAERDDYLCERSGKRYRAENESRWIAISLLGEVILGDTLGEVIHEAHKRWGGGNAALRKLAAFPGLEWVTP